MTKHIKYSEGKFWSKNTFSDQSSNVVTELTFNLFIPYKERGNRDRKYQFSILWVNRIDKKDYYSSYAQYKLLFFGKICFQFNIRKLPSKIGGIKIKLLWQKN